MIILTDQQINKFQTLYYKHFGEKISKEEAYEKGMRLVNLVKVICGPDLDNKQEKLNKT